MTPFDFFLIGIIGGLTPGPMTALLLGETLQHGRRRGMTIPIVMVLSNTCFSLLTLAIVTAGMSLDGLIRPLHVTGALVLFWFAHQDWKSAAKSLELTTTAKSSLFGKALFMEFCNPHPYLFWGTVLAPALLIWWDSTGLNTVLLLCCLFVAGLVGTKILLVLFSAPLQQHLSGKQRTQINRILAALLFLFGLKLLLS